MGVFLPSYRTVIGKIAKGTKNFKRAGIAFNPFGSIGVKRAGIAFNPFGSIDVQ
jgi:hypothetical protein